MKLISVEPTPSPNTMKLNVDEMLPKGIQFTVQAKQPEQADGVLRELLQIEGVRSLFRTADFIAIDRVPNADWAQILQEVHTLIPSAPGSEAADEAEASTSSPQDESYGELHVFVQMVRYIPLQVRVQFDGEEVRAALPDKFTEAVNQAIGNTFLQERGLTEWGVRYGEPDDVLQEVVAEITATYTPQRLQQLVEASQKRTTSSAPSAQPAAKDGTSDAATPPAAVHVRPTPLSGEQLSESLQSQDWEVRYAALDRTPAKLELLPQIAQAIADEHTSIRRLAVIYLGDLLEDEETAPKGEERQRMLELLFTALKDRSPAVRRTAGDTLSDIGDPAAIEPMIESLQDRNKLVRWRAARFLYEVGDERALPALIESSEDPEFEVSLQAKMAMERIERGEKAAGSVWQQMAQMRQKQS